MATLIFSFLLDFRPFLGRNFDEKETLLVTSVIQTGSSTEKYDKSELYLLLLSSV